MSDSKIIKAATTNHSADYVIILERKTDYHPITGRGSHFVEVRVIKPINEDGQTFSATLSTNEQASNDKPNYPTHPRTSLRNALRL
jgi:hypothetical protein